ncbi:hypothetical protein ACNO7O_10445 [Bisgaard Taxon 45]
MEEHEQNDTINQVLNGYRKEVSLMLDRDMTLLSTIDWVFFSRLDQDLSRGFKYVNALICLDKGIYVSKT